LLCIELSESPLAAGISPIRIHYREYGHGFPMLFLHGGWGYQVYPFDRQISELERDFRIIIPDRSGYGRSTHLDKFPFALHAAAAAETVAILDHLKIERCVLWGHSDGAVNAANIAIKYPERIAAIIMEATHYDRHKPKSRGFFTAMTVDPGEFGERMTAKLEQDHGRDYWKHVLAMEGKVWLEILDTADNPDFDLFGGKLDQLRVPTLFLHGEQDPRTEPGELDAIRRLVPHAKWALLPEGKHSLHSERMTSDESTRVAGVFL
jgi:3-oxoadipate enol-lactonase